MELSTQERADLETARETLRRAALGYDDQQLTADPASGRPLTTCPKCGVSWFEDYTDLVGRTGTNNR